MKFIAPAFFVLAIFGCNKPDENHGYETGRYAYHPSAGDMPAIIIDTKTGCLERFVKLTGVDNSKEIIWVRQYADQSIQQVVDGKLLANSAPPKRCLSQQGKRK